MTVYRKMIRNGRFVTEAVAHAGINVAMKDANLLWIRRHEMPFVDMEMVIVASSNVGQEREIWLFSSVFWLVPPSSRGMANIFKDVTGIAETF
jgi:hypothetical protein